MATQPTTPPKKTTQIKIPTPTYPTFTNWSSGREGLTHQELLDIYSTTFGINPKTLSILEGTTDISEAKSLGLTSQDIKNLEVATGIKPTKTPTSTEAKKPVVPPQKITRPAPDLLISRTPYPKWWKDALTARISLKAPGSQVLATVAGKLKLYVATIVITVTEETQITITFGTAGASGPLYLGGEGQPMGIVIAMGNSPAPCGSGNLSIAATDPGGVTPSIGGFATCFVEGT
jgi:hypothetical protein